MNQEILTVVEVTELLKVAGKTVCTMTQRGELPAFKAGGQWRFRRQDVDAWISERITRRGRALAWPTRATTSRIRRRQRTGGRL